MKKLVFVLLLILITIYLFAGSGTKSSLHHVGEGKGYTQSPVSISDNTSMFTDRSSVNPVSGNMPTPVAAAEPASHANCKLSLLPTENDVELWILSQLDNEKIIGMELQMFNSTGERVYYSKFQSDTEKISLSNYKSGKYTIKVGDQVYSIMII
jgi:hypothetical protein